MASPQAIHGHNSPLQNFDTLRAQLEKEKLFSGANRIFYEALKNAQTKQWEETLNTYRLFREEGGTTAGGGGGGSIRETPPLPSSQKAFPLTRITYGNTGYPLGYNIDTGEWHPTQIVDFRLWDDHMQRFKAPVHEDCEALAIRGHIWVQTGDTTGDPPEQHYVHMVLEEGSPTLQAGLLLGFDIGFERFEDTPRKKGKFFIDIFQFPIESHNTPPTKITDEIHNKASKKFRSIDPILNATQIDEYSYENGGQGLKFYCDLTLFVK